MYVGHKATRSQTWLVSLIDEISSVSAVSNKFIVEVNFRLTCAVADDKSLMFQLVLPPEYYTSEGRPIVPWEWLALPNGVSFHNAWIMWTHTRLHLSLRAHRILNVG